MSNGDFFRAAQLSADLSPLQPHLIGVSGGRDSMALLHWLVGQGFRQLIVCHVDHGLRAESGADAEFTKEQSLALGFHSVIRFVDARAQSEARNLSIETAAREVRYAAFAAIAAEFQVPRLLLAHHADDQVETFLLQLLRGAGTGGLGAMAPESIREIDGVKLRIARPFLGVWRTEIDAYVTARGIPFREDATNAGLEPTRNRMRHAALPALEKAFGRDPRPALWRAAELLRADEEILAAAPELQDLPSELSVPWLRGLPLGLQRRVIHKWLRAGGIADVGFDEVEAARRLLHQDIAKVNLPGNRCARRREKRLFLDTQ